MTDVNKLLSKFFGKSNNSNVRREIEIVLEAYLISNKLTLNGGDTKKSNYKIKLESTLL